jgi:uncharacterized protein (TIGR01777 family)
MKILITGATGLVGRHLTEYLRDKYPSYNVCILTRDKTKANFRKNISVYEWDPYSDTIDADALKDLDVIIHLAGESVAQLRWNEDTKRKILDSRIIPTKFLKEKIGNQFSNIKFISASAIGIYGDRGNELLKTTSHLGDTYLAKVCKRWEREIFNIDKSNSYAVRIGIVLANNGGALDKMITPFKFNLGSVLGSGDQYMSWIHIQDLIHIFNFLIHNNTSNKIINAVAPNPVTNKEFSFTLSQSLNKYLFFKAPKFIIEKALGEMSQIVLTSQRVSPDNLLSQDFEFKFSYLKEALNDIINSKEKL